MEGFPLLKVFPLLQEKILSQLEGKGYLRLQQTCHYMNELPQISKNIRVYVDESATLLWKRETENGPLQFQASFIDNRGRKLRGEGLHGLLFKSVRIPTVINEGFEEFCEVLKKHRITAVKVDSGIDTNLTKDQCTALFKILAPVRVELNSIRSKRFEALFNLRKLKQLHLFINPVTALSVAKNFLVKLENVRFDVEPVRPRAPENVLDLMRSILEFLRSESLPKLLSLTLHESYKGEVVSTAVVKEIFRDFYPTVLEEFNSGASQDSSSKEVNLKCKPGSYCALTIMPTYVTIRFSRLPKK